MSNPEAIRSLACEECDRDPRRGSESNRARVDCLGWLRVKHPNSGFLPFQVEVWREEIGRSAPPEDDGDWLYWSIHADAVTEAIAFDSVVRRSGSSILSFRPSGMSYRFGLMRVAYHHEADVCGPAVDARPPSASSSNCLQPTTLSPSAPLLRLECAHTHSS
ncbi:unnamed protein product [Protopolystoma xenopodis]|uniref:Uncharacterized protein n=1 Tax=Protopolystoma xenopodis TaxID=117903 RepID=A0A3S5A6C7_9PLAT|nr:unnamed protein product [Protopolystoma xenopodis]